MDDSSRPRWLRPAMLVGALYLAVSLASSTLAGAAASSQMGFFWRLAAFVVSAVVFVVHVAFEHVRLRSPARQTAWHASVAVGFGGFLLALVANLHDLTSASGYRLRMLIALAAWPLLTAVPAYVVALAVAAVLGARRSRA